MRQKNAGTSGFFEEIVLFAVVSVLFVSSLAVAAYYSSMKSIEYQKEELVNEVYGFVMKIRGFQPLLHNGVEGLFDYHKIKAVTMEELQENLTPNFKFFLRITDTSDYVVHYSTQWGNISNSYGYYRVVVIYPANIWVSDHEIHAAKIEVVAWE